ncbi:hypothetical protein KDK_80100 [Dictyobacter kobayashii]|uniref:CAAX prenyl protease 2/Lysostaphin resistance protein A-like domain-containing protein n=1 Tax=Dictyobacter kobayashii TaxID=2014872 RepID=A0A402AYL9_9CHLR|nr:CPBP family glutamic-type intramembrane protease [Dictyobacter kobayashii]GCE24210.1 hypothetical protein KDK_80100 [Dictyobacter kobayashii]
METSSNIDALYTTTPKTSTLINWKGIGWYLVLAFGISWSMFLLLKLVGVPFIIRAALGMYGPTVAALLVRWLRHEGFADVGLRLRGKEWKGDRHIWRLYVAAYLIPIILLTIGFGIVIALHMQSWAVDEKIGLLLKSLPKTTRALPPANTTALIIVLSACTVDLPITMLATFGEEFGWRGYLLPRLMPLGNVKAALLIGVIWAYGTPP